MLTRLHGFVAGRTTTNEELEEMLEQGNPAVFTQGVSLFIFIVFINCLLIALMLIPLLLSGVE